MLQRAGCLIQKLGMVPEVTLILNLEMNNVTKFKVSIFNNYELRRGVTLTLHPPPPNAE